MNETLKVLEERRSCRNFKPDMITEDELQQILLYRSMDIKLEEIQNIISNPRF